MVQLSSVILLATCIACGSTPDPEPPKPTGDLLEPAHPRQRTLATGEVHRYQVPLETSQVLVATVDQRGIDVVVTTFDPSGRKLADIDGSTGNHGPEPVVIEAKRKGVYAIEVRPLVLPPESKDPPPVVEPDATYEIRIDQVMSADAYAEAELKQTVDSPRLVELWKAVRAKKPNAVNSFWDSLKGKTPIVEPYSADGTTQLVTFVFRTTKPYVGLFGGPGFARERPMVQLAGTDIWYLSTPMPRDARANYAFVVADQPPTFHVPFKPLTGLERKSVVDPNNPGSGGSRFELAGAPHQTWSVHQPANPAGKVVSLELDSVALKEKRRVGIYTPPNYDPSAQYPVVIAFDGEVYGLVPEYNSDGIPLPWILDNLIAAHKIPPVVAALVAEQGKRARDLAMSPAFASFLTTELIPKLRSDYKAGMTSASTIVTGSSLGGMCAAFIGLQHSELVGNVLAQSGAFGYRPGQFERELPDSDDNVLSRAFAKSPKLPLRFYLEAGLFEVDTLSPWSEATSILGMNRRLRDVLEAKGYPVTYSEFSGGHDYFVWRETIVDGLIALLAPSGPPQPAPDKPAPDAPSKQRRSP